MTSTPLPVASQELLLNGDFSDGLNHWTKGHQSKPEVADVVVAKAPGPNGEEGEGPNSAKFTDKSTANGVYLISDSMNVTPGVTYELNFDLFMPSTQVSADELKNPTDTNPQPNRITVYTRYFNAAGTQLSETAPTYYGEGKWKNITIESTAPSEAVTATVWAGLSPFYMAEHAYVANMSFKAKITETVSPITLTIPNGSFENNLNVIPGWTSWGGPWTSCSYQITGEQKSEGNVSLKLVDGSEKETIFMISDPISLVPDVKSHKASVRMLFPNGSASLVLRYYDENDKQV